MGLGKAELSFAALEPSRLTASEFPRWAVLGRSNVGKSSLLNALIHPSKLFRVGKTPGVTRGLIGVRVQLGASPSSILELVDLPGFGFAKSSEARRYQKGWERLVETLREFSQERGLMWVWLIDPGREPLEAEVEILRWLSGEPYIFVFTKADRVPRAKRKERETTWARFIDAATEGPYWVSSMDGEGIDALGGSARQFLQVHRRD